MDEKIYLEEGIVRITSARFVVGTATYPISGITSVLLTTGTGGIGGAVIFLIFALATGGCGITCAMNASDVWGRGAALAPGIIMLALGTWWMISAVQTRWIVKIRTAGKDKKAFITRDEKLARRIAEALNQVLVEKS